MNAHQFRTSHYVISDDLQNRRSRTIIEHRCNFIRGTISFPLGLSGINSHVGGAAQATQLRLNIICIFSCL